MACDKDHSSNIPKQVGKLEDSQRGFWRHKCAGCAYEMGRRDAAAAEERLRERVRELQDKVHAQEKEIEALKKTGSKK